MSELKSFKMPDVGEGLTEADIITWSVKPGDTVTVNQIIVEVETAKAAVELPSPYAGVVTELHAAEGETVDVGRPIITIDTAPQSDSGSDAPPTVASEPQSPVEERPEPSVIGEDYAAPPERQSVLVGYGPRSGGTTSRRPRKQPPVDTPPVETPSANPAFNVTPTPTPADAPEARHRVLAKPPVRKLAKTLGVDLDTVAPTGPNGSVSREDIEQAASAPTVSAPTATPTVPTGRETRIPIRGVRKHTAAAMVASAFTAPHVTEFITIDVTPMMELRERVAARSEFRDVKVSPLLFVAKAVLLAAKRTPEINASWDDAAGEIVLKHYVNLGIAAATDRGLIVPNIKDADQLSLVDLARAIGALTETARAGKTSPAEMSGGSITITNIGVFGIDTGTPILNPGEAGIVAFGAIRKMPWVVDDQIVPRWVTQLSVSFDHRIVDGQQGSQFLADVAAVLADPAMALLL
ncbi:MAG TPA: dihydrolipoamide acetyltransferase family protein [Jatrophihabitantaceae bacterium]|jgi:pyruvate dehydrogenase E2 component (dihydrolipoamide acetyltransferase)